MTDPPSETAALVINTLNLQIIKLVQLINTHISAVNQDDYEYDYDYDEDDNYDDDYSGDYADEYADENYDEYPSEYTDESTSDYRDTIDNNQHETHTVKDDSDIGDTEYKDILEIENEESDSYDYDKEDLEDAADYDSEYDDIDHKEANNDDTEHEGRNNGMTNEVQSQKNHLREDVPNLESGLYGYNEGSGAATNSDDEDYTYEHENYAEVVAVTTESHTPDDTSTAPDISLQENRVIDEYSEGDTYGNEHKEEGSAASVDGANAEYEETEDYSGEYDDYYEDYKEDYDDGYDDSDVVEKEYEGTTQNPVFDEIIIDNDVYVEKEDPRAEEDIRVHQHDRFGSGYGISDDEDDDYGSGYDDVEIHSSASSTTTSTTTTTTPRTIPTTTTTTTTTQHFVERFPAETSDDEDLYFEGSGLEVDDGSGDGELSEAGSRVRQEFFLRHEVDLLSLDATCMQNFVTAPKIHHAEIKGTQKLAD